MNPIRVFISSVQRELAAERAVLRDFLAGDALMRRFFAPFLFEDLPAASRDPRMLARYIERMGTGDMIRRCREAGLAEPAFSVSDGFTTTLWRKVVASTPEVAPEVTHQATHEVTHQVAHQVTHEVRQLALVLDGDSSRGELQEALGLRDPVNFRRLYLLPALEAGVVEMTIPDKPRSGKQRYRLTALGKAIRDNLAKKPE